MNTELLGTVSHGTMRQEDLIPTFLSVLEELDKDQWQVLVDEYQDVLDEFGGLKLEPIDKYGDFVPYANVEAADWLLDDLFNNLNDRAPDGCYFGAHPGDGSDYGFWLVEEF